MTNATWRGDSGHGPGSSASVARSVDAASSIRQWSMPIGSARSRAAAGSAS